MKSKHSAPNGAKNGVDSCLSPYFPDKPSGWKRAWRTMTTQEKIRFLKLYGPTSKLPVSVEIANLINEAKVKAFKDHLVSFKLHTESFIIRISISPNEIIAYSERVYKACLKYAEKVRRRHILMTEVDEVVQDDDEMETDSEGDAEGAKIYGAQRKIETNHLSMIRCAVQILRIESRHKTSFQFSADLTYGSLLIAIENFKSIDGKNLKQLDQHLRDACDRTLEKAHPRRSRRVEYELEILSYVEN